MTKATISMLALGAVGVIVIGSIVFSGDDTIESSKDLKNTLTANIKAGDYPNAQQFADTFLTPIKNAALDSKLNFKKAEDSKSEVVYKNIAFDLKEADDKGIRNVMIKKARFTDDGRGEIKGLLLGSTTKSGENLAIGLKRIDIDNYKVEDGLLVSLDQSFEGGIASGPGLKKMQAQFEKVEEALKDQPEALQELPNELTESLEDINGRINYRYSPKKNTLSTGFKMELPNLASLQFSLGLKEVDKKSAKLMQQSVLFGGGVGNLSGSLKDYDFKGILQQGEITLYNDGLIDKALTIVATLQKGSADLETTKAKTSDMAVKLIERYQPPAKAPESSQDVLKEIRSILANMVTGDAESITLKIHPKENGVAQTLPQAVQSGFAQYSITAVAD